jgi:SAM-dependent methyltransferase
VDDATRARSFGAVAEDYDRLRPSPPPEAVAWLLPPGARTVLDLAAGTGLLTRALLAAGVDVVAVEPDDRMRAVLAARSPQVRAVAGVGEDLPLPDASVDAVLVSSAWHWMDPARAVPEVARVLRDGGRFGAVWTGHDRQAPWALDVERERAGRGRAAATPAGGAPGRDDRRHSVVDLPEGSPFATPETTVVRRTRLMPVEDVVALMGTYSDHLTAAPEEQERSAAVVRAALARSSPGAEVVDVPVLARCWRADRLDRR